MPSKDTQYKIYYNKEKVIEEILTYFFEHELDEPPITEQPFAKLYETIVKESKIKMPKFSTARTIIRDELIEYKLLSNKDRITSETVCRLTSVYRYMEDFEYMINQNPGRIVQCDVITCILPLPSDEYLSQVISGIQKNGKKFSRYTLINTLCRIIKTNNRKVVIAAIPESNPVITMKNRQNSGFSPVTFCSAICLYVKNTSEGQEFIKKLKKSPPNESLFTRW